MFLRIMEFSILTVIALGVITQLLIPALMGTQSFPLFRREQKLIDELTAVQQEQREKTLIDNIKAEKEHLK